MSAREAGRICRLEQALRDIQAEQVLISAAKDDTETVEHLDNIDTICEEALNPRG